MASQMLGVRLAGQHEKEIEKLLRVGLYVSASEFIREAVKEKLESMGTKSVPDGLAEDEIRWFLKERKGMGQAFVSIMEIMHELMLPPQQIERIMARMKGVKEV